MQHFIQSEIHKTVELLKIIQADSTLSKNLEAFITVCFDALSNGNKIIFAGNGGSAADCQHLAAELVGRLRYERPGLAAISLTTDTSILTAVSNDYAFEYIFSRQIEALGNYNDIFIALSTSGKSPNILKALTTARGKGLITFGLTGEAGDAMIELCDHALKIPSTDTQKIQEVQLILGHILCAAIEEKFYQLVNPALRNLHYINS